MAFDRAQGSVPVAIGGIEVRLYLADPEKPGDKNSIEYRVMVKHSNGGQQERTGDLVAHLTAQERTQQLAFMNSLRLRAIEEILPTP